MRILTILLALVLSGCSGAVLTPDPARPPPPAASPAPSRPLPGLETLGLAGRQKALFWQVVSQLYAPCASEAVSIRQCLEEARPCAACAPAARLLGDKIKAGADAEEARALYGVRFGNAVKQVDVADSPARGPADAPVTIVVWSDFECPHCKRALPIVERVFAKHSPRVRLVHKFYPLRQHSRAEPAARAAIAAQNQGRYWEMERLLFDHQDELGDADLAHYADELQLDRARFDADLTAERTGKILARDHQDAERAGLSGTPFILINGREFDSAHFHPDPDLDDWVSLELELLAKR